MKYIIGIPTVNRYPKKNYLKTTLRSLQEGGVFDYPDVKVIVSDSGSQNGLLHIRDYTKEYQDIWHKITFLENKEKLSANANNSKIINYCAELTDNYVIYMQDDQIVRPDLMKYINIFIEKYSDAPVWTFYASYGEVLKQAKKGIDKWDYPYKNYYGSLCYALRKNDALSYAKMLKEHADKGQGIGGDMILKKWLRDNYPEKKYLVASCPCYTQHIGEESMLSASHGIRRNQSFDEFFGKK